LPLQFQPLVEVAVEVVDAQRAGAGAELDGAVLRRGAVPAGVVDHGRAVEQQPGAVVAGEPEVVFAGCGDSEVTAYLGDEPVRHAEVGCGGPVDRGHELVDVGGLAGLERAVVVQDHLDVEHAHRHAGFLWRDGGSRGGVDGDERDHGDRSEQGE
jgi:hypothetical protein